MISFKLCFQKKKNLTKNILTTTKIKYKKKHIRETKNLSTDLDSRTDTISEKVIETLPCLKQCTVLAN